MGNVLGTLTTFSVYLTGTDGGTQAKAITNAIVARIPDLTLYKVVCDTPGKYWAAYQYKNTRLLIMLGNHDGDSWYLLDFVFIPSSGTPSFSKSANYVYLGGAVGADGKDTTASFSLVSFGDFYYKLYFSKNNVGGIRSLEFGDAVSEITGESMTLAFTSSDSSGTYFNTIKFDNPFYMLDNDPTYTGTLSQLNTINHSSIMATAGFTYAFVPKNLFAAHGLNKYYGAIKYGGKYTPYIFYHLTDSSFVVVPGMKYVLDGTLTITAVQKGIVLFVED